MLDDSVLRECGGATPGPQGTGVDGPPDASELERLLAQHTPYLITYLDKHLPESVRSHIEIEDVLQEIFASAFLGRKAFRFFVANSFERWITTIADRRLVDLRRAELALKRGGGRRKYPFAPPGESPGLVRAELAAPNRTPSREVAVDEARSALLAALATLPEGERDVVVQIELQGRPRGDVARERGITDAAVRGILLRARERLRDRLGDPARYFSESTITNPRRDADAR